MKPTPAIPRRSFLPSVAILAACLVGQVAAESVRNWSDPGFETTPAGTLAATGINDGWEVQRTGREAIKDRLVAACAVDAAAAKSGSNCLSLSIPKDTATVFAVLALDAYK